MSLLIIGNIIMFAASIIMVSIGLIKSNKTVIVVQTIQIAMMAIGNLLLGSVPGAIVNAVSVVRNLLCYGGKMNKFSKSALIVSSSILSLLFNNIGVVGILPILSTSIYTCFMDTKSSYTMKWLIIGTSALWAIHDAYIQAYSIFIFDIMTIVSSFVGLIIIRKELKNSNNSSQERK